MVGVETFCGQPIRVRHGTVDLGLHLDIRESLLRSARPQRTEVPIIFVSDSEEEVTQSENKKARREDTSNKKASK